MDSGLRRNDPASPKGYAAASGRRRFEDLSAMTREVVVHVAKCMQCTREEIVEGLND